MLLWEYTTHYKTLNVLEFTSRFWYALIWPLCLSLELIDWKVSIHWWLWLTSVRRQFLTPRESGRIKITHNIICMCSHISSHFDLTCLFQVTRIKTYFVFLPVGSPPKLMHPLLTSQSLQRNCHLSACFLDGQLMRSKSYLAAKKLEKYGVKTLVNV